MERDSVLQSPLHDHSHLTSSPVTSQAAVQMKAPPFALTASPVQKQDPEAEKDSIELPDDFKYQGELDMEYQSTWDGKAVADGEKDSRYFPKEWPGNGARQEFSDVF